MPGTFSQFDHDLTAKLRFEAKLEPRRDRRLIIYAAWSVFEALDRLTPKKKELPVYGQRCRVNELLTTWGDLSAAAGWTEGPTALRSVIDRFAAPLYIQLPWAPEGHYEGIRILRMMHAGHGVICRAYDPNQPARSGRILCGMWLTLERIFHVVDQGRTQDLGELEGLVDRLLEPRPIPEDAYPGVDLKGEPPPPFCSGCGESYRGIGDPALFTPADVASRIVEMSQASKDRS